MDRSAQMGGAHHHASRIADESLSRFHKSCSQHGQLDPMHQSMSGTRHISYGAAHHIASPMGMRDATGAPRPLPPSAMDHEQNRALYTSSTPIGKCWLDTAGHLKPCDDKHAPIRLYRSYGEWWEAGCPNPELPVAPPLRHNRNWPYGQDVTKLYQTEHNKHTYQLDQRMVSKAKPYIPPRNGSLPDLRHHRDTRQQDMDLSYHTSFNATDPRANMLGFSSGKRSPQLQDSGRGQETLDLRPSPPGRPAPRGPRIEDRD